MEQVPDQDEGCIKIKVILLENYLYSKLGLYQDKYLNKARQIIANFKRDNSLAESVMKN